MSELFSSPNTPSFGKPPSKYFALFRYIVPRPPTTRSPSSIPPGAGYPLKQQNTLDSAWTRPPYRFIQSKSTRSWWDSIVRVAFCICVLLLARALTGVGHRAGSGTAGHALPIASGYRSASADANPTQGVDELRDIAQAAGSHNFAYSDARPEPAIQPPTPTVTSLDTAYTSPARALGQSPNVPLWFYSHYDPRRDTFFDPAEYDKDGQPFALRIHVNSARFTEETPRTRTHGTGRCRSFRNGRCQSELQT
ncbi:hypothetical protein PLICRDRAFT_41426 [Plicaturopsis crispa FD-325 SS-3]|nr:hypothetical protein PLICRDRAFT_41426 [Plicaturopsis crispa FD-325 SS-3]